ncbi:beta-glucuronidase-like [Anoplophora glabripennis]|uniref:beta-glucuronidase-like n=1 Tax=Anoplophora glabripennis TaxID=217634 RepID=UPI000874AE1B|nr:beta-glucuronidase-like [Anoplophora glabripennis]
MNKVLFFLAILLLESESGILYPKANSVREVLSLDGLWKFSLVNSDTKSFTLADNDEDIEFMPVPASYNDISTNLKVRDYVGEVKYQRNFAVPKSWEDRKIWLRFGSVCYSAKVYINSELALSHEIGHLPFVGDVTSYLNFENENNITVIVNNILTTTTIPQGSLSTLPGGRVRQRYTFDFFNYAGIDRPVVLYTTAQTYIDDITLHTTVNGTTGIVQFQVTVTGEDTYTSKITVIDQDGKDIATNEKTLDGSLVIPNVNLWWPYLMHDNPGYQYTFRVELLDSSNKVIDKYDQRFGVRQLSWDSTSFKINGKNIYIRGFGRHEDSDIRGKGLDLPLIVRDHNLIKWIGANCYRTSHYPYAEEIMDLADSQGIMIIDEVPAVNTDNFSDELLENHKRSITEMIKRDKNRPSVIMWSAANEPRTAQESASAYYNHVITHVKAFDRTRPVTVVNLVEAGADHSGQYLDILSMNRYDAWYSYEGDLDVIVPDFVAAAKAWHNKHNKPVLVTEYGADTLEGYHSLPAFIWSEEFQNELLSNHFKAFDQLREEGWFIGEMIWVFSDFRTDQAVRRVGGNKKGLFTRQRQPKSSAHLMRKRFWHLAHELDNATLPGDLDNFVIDKSSQIKDEL